jgi:geranylgeranyl pyrophosphate synthase
MGALAALAPEAVVEGLRNFGVHFGLGFQIIEDCLVLELTSETLGKDAMSDLAMGKATYPSVVGLEAYKEKARALIDGAIAGLRPLPVEGAVLEGIARYILTRAH